MTATVIPFKARTVTTGCQCPRHQLDALAARVSDLLSQTAESLLIPRTDLEHVLDDLTETTDRLIPPNERTNP